MLQPPQQSLLSPHPHSSSPEKLFSVAFARRDEKFRKLRCPAVFSCCCYSPPLLRRRSDCGGSRRATCGGQSAHAQCCVPGYWCYTEAQQMQPMQVNFCTWPCEQLCQRKEKEMKEGQFLTCVGRGAHAQALPRTWAAAHQLSELYSTTGPWEPGPARAKKLPPALVPSAGQVAQGGNKCTLMVRALGPS